jgi:glycosyltransferase involved in cell wall biosynthesis
MRIACFVRLLPAHRGVGGMQGHAQNLYRGLAKRGHEISVFTTSCPQKSVIENDNGVLVHYLPNCTPAEYSSEYRALSKQACLAQHQEKPFDIIHSESSAALQMCEQKIPVVATWHGLSYCGFRSKVNQEIASSALHKQSGTFWQEAIVGITKEFKDLEKYDHHVAISHQAYDDLLSIYRIPKEKATLVFNGFDTDLFYPDPKAGEVIRHSLKIPTSSYVMGVAGRLTVDKGHRFLIRTLPILLNKYPRLRLLIVGGSGVESEYLQLKHPSIIYVGAKSYKEMPAFYNAMNVFLNPTYRYLGLDMTMQEAMLCGVPVIATDTGSIKKSLIVNEKFGYTHPLANRDDFSRCIEKISYRTDFDAKSISEYVKKFSSQEAMCSGMEKVFNKVLGR